MRFIGHVRPAVNAQAGHVRVAFVADVTFVRPVSGVQGRVGAEARDAEERLPAVRTVVGFLIPPEVPLQLFLRLKMFSAHSTNVLRLVNVTPSVFDQTALQAVPDPAHSADLTALCPLALQAGCSLLPPHLQGTRLPLWLPVLVRVVSTLCAVLVLLRVHVLRAAGRRVRSPSFFTVDGAAAE